MTHAINPYRTQWNHNTCGRILFTFHVTKTLLRNHKYFMLMSFMLLSFIISSICLWISMER